MLSESQYAVRPQPIGRRPEVALRLEQVLDALGIHAPHRVRAGKPVQASYNASQLAPVKRL